MPTRCAGRRFVRGGRWGEPRVKPLSWSVDSVDECIADTGDALTPDRRGMGALVTGRLNTRNDTQLILRGPIEKAKQIAKLRMTATFLLEQQRESLDVPNVLTVHNATYQLGGFRVVIKDVNKMVEGRYAYELTVFRDGKSPKEWNHMHSLMNTPGRL